jgi:hypothetical protein
MVRFKSLKAVNSKMTVCLDTTPCSLSEIDRRIKDVYCCCLSRIVTADETWVHNFELETKRSRMRNGTNRTYNPVSCWRKAVEVGGDFVERRGLKINLLTWICYFHDFWINIYCEKNMAHYFLGNPCTFWFHNAVTGQYQKQYDTGRHSGTETAGRRAVGNKLSFVL